MSVVKVLVSPPLAMALPAVAPLISQWLEVLSKDEFAEAVDEPEVSCVGVGG